MTYARGRSIWVLASVRRIFRRCSLGLYDAHKEYAQHSDKDPQYREIVCQQMTDLLAVSPISDREMITDVLITLLRQSETRFESCDDGWAVVVAEQCSFAYSFCSFWMKISIARPIIKNSPVPEWPWFTLYHPIPRYDVLMKLLLPVMQLKKCCWCFGRNAWCSNRKKFWSGMKRFLFWFCVECSWRNGGQWWRFGQTSLMRLRCSSICCTKNLCSCRQEIKALRLWSVALQCPKRMLLLSKMFLHDVVSEFSAEYRGGSPYTPTEVMLRAAAFMKQGVLWIVF